MVLGKEAICLCFDVGVPCCKVDIFYIFMVYHFTLYEIYEYIYFTFLYMITSCIYVLHS